MQLTKEKQDSAFSVLKDTLGYINPMQAARIEKVVVSSGVGRVTDKGRLEMIQGRLSKITGQSVAPRRAKKSIASFKVRQGDAIGYQVTLRGARMYDFLDRLLNIALPRTRDFRGISPSAIDEMGNLTIGVREHTVFPETADEDLKDIFGLAITIVTTAKTREEARAFLTHLGVPFKKE